MIGLHLVTTLRLLRQIGKVIDLTGQEVVNCVTFGLVGCVCVCVCVKKRKDQKSFVGFFFLFFFF
jgi:hypothetical protein